MPKIDTPEYQKSHVTKIRNLKPDLFNFRAHEPVKTCSEAECFHNKPPAMRVVSKGL